MRPTGSPERPERSTRRPARRRTQPPRRRHGCASLSEAAGLAALLQPPKVAEAGKEHRWRDEPWRQIRGLGNGIEDGVEEPVKMVGDLTGITADASESWAALRDGLEAAADDPWAALLASLPLQELSDGEVGYALGTVIPGAVAAFYTGGAAAGLKGSEAAARAAAGLRAARLAHARRIASSGLPMDAGVIDWSALRRGAKIPLADGSSYQLTPEELAVGEAWAKNAKPGDKRADGNPGAYQDLVYPGGEIDLGNKTFPDGINPDFLALGDAKLRENAQSW